MLSPVVAGALRAAMQERLVINHAQQTAAGLCDWCQRPFTGPRFHMNDAQYCTAACRDLDTEVVL